MEKNISNIVHKYVSGSSTKEELEQAIHLLEDPYHNLALRPTLYKLWNCEDLENINAPIVDDFPDLLNKIHHKINLEKKSEKRSKVQQTLLNISRIAAVLIVGIVLGVLAHTYNKTETVYYTSYAPKGSISQMVLPDSTMVYLNSGSELKYSIQANSKKREVFLKGEAWFHVRKNTQKQFVVHTPYYNVNVCGTEFNVKAYPGDNEITTTLEKGSIQISSTKNFKIQSKQILKPGEQLIYNIDKNTIELKMVKTRFYTSWKENKLIFINMNLKELITLIERKYGVDIEVTDPSIFEYHYDGTFKDETIIEVLEILKQTLPITYTIEGQKVKIIKH